MKTLKFSIVCLLALTALLLSCNGNNADTTKPVILLEEPCEGDSILIGDPDGMHLEMDLSDDVMLREYLVEIHNNFDQHGHDAPAVQLAAEDEQPFAFRKSWDLTGNRTKHVHHHEILIPENAQEGDYHIMIYCTDAAGNESYVARSIVLSHTASEHEDEHDEDED
ncbi:MAG: DUF4625 domain-containing protein [Prevotellaceae bacterium]|jgi:hypothetical protein|nr:DUF4625 domain-containing protein [Prevotellaceae bacterium]